MNPTSRTNLEGKMKWILSLFGWQPRYDVQGKLYMIIRKEERDDRRKPYQ